MQRNEWKRKSTCPLTKTDSEQTNSVKQLMAFWSCQTQRRCSNRALWEKWFQKLVITALITYSALSFPPPFLTLPPVSLFISASTWLRFRARRLSLCHPHFFLLLSSSVWSNGNCFFLFSFSFQLLLHLPVKPLSFLTVRCPAWTVALITRAKYLTYYAGLYK